MSRIVPITVVVLALVAASCTSNDVGEIATSTTSDTPVTTLPPAGGDTTSSTGGSGTASSTSSTTTTTIALPALACEVASDTRVEGYAQGCDVLGMTVLAAEDVDPVAVEGLAERVYEMLRFRPDLVAAVVDAGLAGRVIGADETITALPEFTELYEQYPGFDWRRRGRWFPATDLVPFFAGAEENLMCLDDDFYTGEDSFVRTFGLTMKRFGIDVVDPATAQAIDQAYGRAIAQGLWENTLAEINADEYWMEGTQSFFDANIEDDSEDREPNSSHNAIDTRDELREYDPALWTILASVYGDTEWRPSCP